MSHPFGLVDFLDVEPDELDVIGSSRSSTTLISDGSPPVEEEKLTIKLRVSPSRNDLRSGENIQTTGKRVRTTSLSAIDNGANSQKKQKMQDKKANTIVINARRVQLESARRRWLYRHHDLFQPLLPSTLFFDTLRREMKETGGDTVHVPLHALTTQPSLVEGGEMKDYQLQGLAFLIYMYKNGMNCILGDEMGLGKTLQTLSFFAHIQENEPGRHDPHLIICPLSVLSSWQNEAARWVPSLRVFRFHGTQSERNRLKNSVRNDEMKFDLCITTYEAYVCEDSWFKSRRWFYCVLDEGHRIKNSDTNLFSKVRGIGSLYRLILTGTPVQNNLVELWGLLSWLYPTIFTPPSQRLFHESFDLSRGSYSIPFLKAAQELLLAIMMRRTKANVDIAVPPREELTLFIPMTEAQRFWTYRLLTRMDTMDLEEIFTEEGGPLNEGRKEVFSHIASAINRSVSGETNRWRKLMNLLMQLRKVCDHPYLLKDASPSPYIIGEHVVASSSKLIVIDKLLADTLPKGERVLIFSQWTSMLDLLEDYMELRSIPYARLDGGTSRPRRNLDIKLFQQEKSPYQVFLVSTKAGGLGINLTKASTVIMCDCDWNPQNDLQAIARAHRIGQTKTVKVYRLICRGSVEDQMLDRIRRKMFLSLKVMCSSTSSSTNEDNTQLKTTELLDILRKGSSALSRSDVGMDLGTFLKAPIQEILDDSREREEVRDVKLKKELVSSHDTAEEINETTLFNAEEEERKLLSGIAQVQSRLFEGKLITRNQNNHQIAQEWQDLQKQAHIDRTVVVDGITVIADHMGQSAPEEISPASKKKSKVKYETEDWCVYCRDGGEVILCTLCPRVFHLKCHGITKAQFYRQPMICCPQHKCSTCDRSTAESGGMLFRCQTCPQAFCEDCMPVGEIDAVGEVLPEFVLLGYGATSAAYYIRCHECHEHWKQEPQAWKVWEEEMAETQAKLESLETK